MKPHKHAALIKAWADGAEIQFRVLNSGSSWMGATTPTWDNGLEFRVQPHNIICNYHARPTKDGLAVHLNLSPNLRLTYEDDGITLLKAEVL